jgi:hypothetical protein
VTDSAFSNGTEFAMWEANWCGRCQVDAAFRRGDNDPGCPVLATALLGDGVPPEWLEQPADRYPSDAYHCINFRGPDYRDPEPKPQPEPPDMDGLFDRPPRQTRLLAQGDQLVGVSRGGGEDQ